MKSTFLFIICLFCCGICLGQKSIFLHHSTGNGVYYDGNVENLITTYNTENKTHLEIAERNYPDTPWPWENYPYDFWKLWVDGSCDSNEPGIECLAELCANYDVIIFKHCFPGASIQADNSAGNIGSPEKTLPSYKLQYRALREKFDQFPNNKFMVWTLAPLHRLATNADEAQRANEFVNWVKATWLNEDGKSHPNIFVFDFYGLAAEMETNPSEGQQYCLKYSYEGSHESSDSHPNLLANQIIGSVFAQRIIEVASSAVSTDEVRTPVIHSTSIYPNAVLKGQAFTVKLPTEKCTQVQVIDMNGRLHLQRKITQTEQISTGELNPGIYLVALSSSSGHVYQRLLVK